MVVRYKTWTDEEEQLIVEAVIKHLISGKSRLQAFEFASKKLGRSSTSIAYRWNTKLGKENQVEVEQARMQYKESKSLVKGDKLYLSDVIDYVNNVNEQLVQLTAENKRLKKQLINK